MNDEQETKKKVMFTAASKLLEASKYMMPYNNVLSDVVLSISEAITKDIIKDQNYETDPDKSKRMNKENVEAIRNELGEMIKDVKKEIEDE